MTKSFYYFIANNGFQRIAFDLVGLFGVLYLYKLFGNSVELSIGLLSLIYILMPFFTFLFLPFMEKIGTRKSIILGGTISVLSVIPMFYFETRIWLYFALWVCLASIAKVFYYIPYHYYTVKFTEGNGRGKQMSFVNSLILFLSVLTPLIGGFATQYWGVVGIAMMTIFFAILAVIPLFKIEDYHFKISENMMGLLVQPDLQQTLKLLVITEFQAKETFWQLYIFIFVGSSFGNFGIIISLATLLTIPLLLFFGKFSDHHNKKWFIRVHGVVSSIIWVACTLVNSLFQVVFVDILNKVNYNIRNQTLGIVLYDLANKDKQDDLLDEKIILRESFDNLALGLGLLSGAVIVYFFGFAGVFIFAAIVALLFTRV